MATWRDLFAQALYDDGVIFDPDEPFSTVCVNYGERELDKHTSVRTAINVQCGDTVYRSYVNPKTGLVDIVSANVRSSLRTSGVYERMSPVHLRCIGFSGLGERVDLASLIIEESSREDRDQANEARQRLSEFIGRVEHWAIPYVPSPE